MEKIEGIPEISALTLKNLGDKSYDRRKCSAEEITAVFARYYVEFASEVIIDRMREMKTKRRKYWE